MLSRKVATICLAVCLAGWNSAQAWQLVAEYTEKPVTGFDGEPVYPNGVAQTSLWLSEDPNHPMYDTSLIPRWNRRFEYEGAAGVPPERAWWVPSAITGQLLWLNRTGADPTTLLTGGVLDAVTLAVDHSPAVTMSDLQMPVEAGVRLSMLLGKPGHWQPELAYLGIFDQNATINYAPIASTGVIETGTNFFDMTLFSAVTEMSVSYESDFHSTEWNMWYDDGWRFQMLLGARWILQEEEFEQFETQNWDNRTFAEFNNNLIGGQIGFRTFLFERGKLSAFVIAKGGIYRNEVDLFADVQSGGVLLGSMAQSGSTTSYSGELNLTANWQLTPYCNIHCGYTGLWLTQVGLVGDQLNDFTFAAGGGSFDFGGISYQGGHLGVTFAW